MERLETENEAKAMFVQGASALQSGDALTAGGAFAVALRINPEYQEAREYLEEARKLVQAAGLEGLDMSAPDAQSVMQPWQKGVDAFLAGDYRLARIEFNNAKQKRPTFAKLGEFLELARQAHNAECERLNNKARAAYDQGDLVKAVALWKAGVAENPKSEVLLQSLESVKGVVAQKTEEWYKQAVEEARQGRHQDAVVLLEKVVALDPENGNARKRLDESREKHAKMSNIISNL
jgi:tetratricopeptide (TPR) repeat protein